jgi:solute carrier family 25 aspartate/glutamate transporter 12/13
VLGSIAGGIGACSVYPIDLVKTRMQNQRFASPGDRIYKNSIDCFRTVLGTEGVRGLYRGIFAQLAGVAPEKALKLTINDSIRKLGSGKQGEISFATELTAGAAAGASQVLTNPLELVKIRLQTQGEASRLDGAKPKSAFGIVRELGARGLWKGSGALLLRDVPFGALYFPTYATAKSHLSRRRPDGLPQLPDLFLAGVIAGVPVTLSNLTCFSNAE